MEGFSLLEQEAARAPTQCEHQSALDFACRSWPPMANAAPVKEPDESAVGEARVCYRNALCQAGAHISLAEELMAGVLHFNPGFARHGARQEAHPERLWNFTYPGYCNMFRLCLQGLRVRSKAATCYLADCFSGKGGAGRAAMAIGAPVRHWGAPRGAQVDLARRSVLGGLCSDIAKGMVSAGCA
ncbi:unnamed protein product, partial [Prorocentrum cordatum]